jgi:hypothetical protein
MLQEQPSQLPLADAQSFCQFIDAAFIAVERTFCDEGQRARYRVGGAAP